MTTAIVQNVLGQISCPKPKHLPASLYIDEFNGNADKQNSKLRRWNKIKFLCSSVNADSGAVIDIRPFTDGASQKILHGIPAERAPQGKVILLRHA